MREVQYVFRIEAEMEPFDAASAGSSLLFVEDAPLAREIISRLIPVKYPGMKLHIAENGIAGLELFKEHQPEIVITDISMPLMDGIQMATEIRLLNPDTIIIVLSAHSKDRFPLDSSEIRVSHFIQKPLIYGELVTIIDKYIGPL